MMNRLTLGVKNKFPLIDLAKYGTLARKSIHPDLLIGNYPIGQNQFKEGDILDANAVWNLIVCNNDALGVTQMNDHLKAVERGLRETEEAVQDSLEQVQQNTRNIENLTEDSQDHSDRIQNLEESVSNINESIEDIQESIATTNQAIEDANQAIVNTNQAIADTNSAIESLQQEQTATNNAIREVEQSVGNIGKYKHVFMTQAKYDALQSYERNTIYFIWDGEDDEDENESGFPETFPITFGGTQKFPLIFPITFGDTPKFPLTFPVELT